MTAFAAGCGSAAPAAAEDPSRGRGDLAARSTQGRRAARMAHGGGGTYRRRGDGGGTHARCALPPDGIVRRSGVARVRAPRSIARRGARRGPGYQLLRETWRGRARARVTRPGPPAAGGGGGTPRRERRRGAANGPSSPKKTCASVDGAARLGGPAASPVLLMSTSMTWPARTVETLERRRPLVRGVRVQVRTLQKF